VWTCPRRSHPGRRRWGTWGYDRETWLRRRRRTRASRQRHWATEETWREPLPPKLRRWGAWFGELGLAFKQAELLRLRSKGSRDLLG
jgi:hypothetical protein